MLVTWFNVTLKGDMYSFYYIYIYLQYFENFNVFRYIKEIMDGVEKLKLMINW